MTTSSSNTYGRLEYYRAKSHISYEILRQEEKEKYIHRKSNIIIPIIVGSIVVAAGIIGTMLFGDLNSLNHQYQELHYQYQNLENQVQNINTLTEILFGSNNSYDISAIQINCVQIENGTAYVQGTVSSSGANVTLEIPVNYVEKW
jgi:flagellar basal body-associated protein FliL